MCIQNLKFAALPVAPDIIGDILFLKFGSPWKVGNARRSLFSKIFNGLLFGWTMEWDGPCEAAKFANCKAAVGLHGDSHGYGYGMVMGTVMNPHIIWACGNSEGDF